MERTNTIIQYTNGDVIENKIFVASEISSVFAIGDLIIPIGRAYLVFDSDFELGLKERWPTTSLSQTQDEPVMFLGLRSSGSKRKWVKILHEGRTYICYSGEFTRYTGILTTKANP